MTFERQPANAETRFDRGAALVLAANGLNVNSAQDAWLTRFDLTAWRVGATLAYTVQRAGQMVDVPVTLRQPDAASVWRALANAPLDSPGQWSWLVVAVLVFWLRPGSRAARLLLVMMVSQTAETKLGWAAAAMMPRTPWPPSPRPHATKWTWTG